MSKPSGSQLQLLMQHLDESRGFRFGGLAGRGLLDTNWRGFRPPTQSEIRVAAVDNVTDQPLSSASIVAAAPVTCLIGLVAVAIACIPRLQHTLQFDVTAVVSGELWRVVTGHLTHWNLEYCFRDLSVSGVLGALCKRRNRNRFFAGIVAGDIAILTPETGWDFVSQATLFVHSREALVPVPMAHVLAGIAGAAAGLRAVRPFPRCSQQIDQRLAGQMTK